MTSINDESPAEDKEKYAASVTKTLNDGTLMGKIFAFLAYRKHCDNRYPKPEAKLSHRLFPVGLILYLIFPENLGGLIKKIAESMGG